MEIEHLTEGDVAPAEKVVPQAPRKSTRKRSIMIFGIVSLVNVALLALLWSQLLTPAQNVSQGQAQTVQQFFSGPLVGKAAPDFSLSELGGRGKISLSDFKGRPVVLNVWQSSCVPCGDEAGLLESSWKQAQAKGIVFLGIDFQDVQGDALKFVQSHGVTYRSVFDSDGTVTINYGVTGTPTTFFIDKRGVIVGTRASELTAQQLQAGLQLLSR
jgi:cytochrome c biogenesis protein CcmG/thiol:disulfide interchange protein DsbE